MADMGRREILATNPGDTTALTAISPAAGGRAVGNCRSGAEGGCASKTK